MSADLARSPIARALLALFVNLAPGISLEHRLQCAAVMTTMGQLISVLFTKYQDEYHDEQLAAVATQVALDDLLRVRRRLAKRARPVAFRCKAA